MPSMDYYDSLILLMIFVEFYADFYTYLSSHEMYLLILIFLFE